MTNNELFRSCYRVKLFFNNSWNKRINYFLSTALTVLFFSTATANPKELSARYSLYFLGAHIGEFFVTQTTENETMKIEAVTDVNANLFISYRVKYIQNTIYKNGILQSSHVETYKNERLNSEIWLLIEKESYWLVVDGDTTIVNDLIAYSGSLVYFNEPGGIKKIFKERNAETMWISPVKEHEYIVNDIKGREINRYYYENGTLQYAKMRHALGILKFKRITLDE